MWGRICYICEGGRKKGGEKFVKRAVHTWLAWTLISFVMPIGGEPAFAGDRGLAEEEDSPVPTYRAMRVSDARVLSDLRSSLGRAGMEIVLKVNRRDARHLRRGITLMVPETVEDVMIHTPFPAELPEAVNLPKLLLVSLSHQAFAAYEGGRQVRWGPVNTGSRKQPTPPNLYHTNWRSPRRVSTINRSWIMPLYFNIHTAMGLAIHQYEMPGSPVSYGCIRMMAEDARWFYDWADPWVPEPDGRRARVYGTPVIVFGEYAYDETPPWLLVAEDPSAGLVPPEEVSGVVQRYVGVLEERARSREMFLVGRDGG